MFLCNHDKFCLGIRSFGIYVVKRLEDKNGVVGVGRGYRLPLEKGRYILLQWYSEVFQDKSVTGDSK